MLSSVRFQVKIQNYFTLSKKKMQAKSISFPKITRLDYEIPERYRNAFYLANASFFDSANWFLHRTYEVIFHSLKNTYRQRFKDQKVGDVKVHEKLENIVEALDHCNSIIDVRFPFRRDNGKLEVVRGFKAHYGETVYRTPCLGGLRIHQDLTRDHMKALAMLSFMKNSCVGTCLSGGAGGIKINHKEYSEGELKTILRLYVMELFKKGYCNHTSVVHPDINTSGREMTWISEAFTTCTGHSLNASSTGKPLDQGGVDNYDEVAALGALKALETFLNNGEIMLKTGCIKTGLKNKRFIIQGLGKVGKPLSLMLVDSGAICVGVKEHDVNLYDSKGIDLKDLFKYMDEQGTMVNYGMTKNDTSDSILTEECDILVLAACHKSLVCYVARDVKARIVLEASDGPVTPTAHKILITKSKLVVPDIFACAGANVASCFEYLKNLQQIGVETESILSCSNELYATIFKNMQHQQGQQGVADCTSQAACNVFLPVSSDFSKNCLDCVYSSVGQEITKNVELFKLGVDVRTAAYAAAIKNIFNAIFDKKTLL